MITTLRADVPRRYEVTFPQGSFFVVDPSGKVICLCTSQAEADRLAERLNAGAPRPSYNGLHVELLRIPMDCLYEHVRNQPRAKRTRRAPAARGAA